MNQARIVFAFLLMLAIPSFAKAPAYYYLAPDSVDLKTYLSGPPAPGSAQDKADIQAVLALQKSRTAFQLGRIRSEVDLSPVAFDTVLGTGFNATNFPLTFALLYNATLDASAISSAAKKLWNRPRPPLQDPAIHPAVPVPPTPSYPSGHAMRGALWAIILTKLAPNLHDQLLPRGAQIGRDRIIAGVHFPTDVAAGQQLGIAIAHRMFKSLAFQRDLARAKAEFLQPLNSPNMRTSIQEPHIPVPAGSFPAQMSL
jgi:membrane-associated phospholipid phosphatase